MYAYVGFVHQPLVGVGWQGKLGPGMLNGGDHFSTHKIIIILDIEQ